MRGACSPFFENPPSGSDYPDCMPRHRSALVSVTLTAMALAVNGCALQATSPVTDQQARVRFLTLLNDAQTLIGGEWSVMDDPTPRDCVIPLGVSGERYPALRVGDPPSAVDAAASRVEQAWQLAGITVTRTTIGEVVEVKGESGDGELIVLRVSDSASTLLGESECRPR